MLIQNCKSLPCYRFSTMISPFFFSFFLCAREEISSTGVVSFYAPCSLKACKRNSKSNSQKLIAYKTPIEKYIVHQEEASRNKKRQQEFKERIQQIHGVGFDHRQLCIASTAGSQAQSRRSPCPTKADLRAVRELNHWEPPQVISLGLFKGKLTDAFFNLKNAYNRVHPDAGSCSSLHCSE